MQTQKGSGLGIKFEMILNFTYMFIMRMENTGYVHKTKLTVFGFKFFSPVGGDSSLQMM